MRTELDTLQNLPKPAPAYVTRPSGMREIFAFVVVEQVDSAWGMHWAPRSEQAIALCGKSTMPTNLDPDQWGRGKFCWCEECARIKSLILPTQR